MNGRKIGWHFVGNTLRDGRPVPADGVWLEHTGPAKMCESGLHLGITPWNALQYAPGPTLCLCAYDDDEVTRDGDKILCRRRMILTRMDATPLLRYFSRMQALSVIHLWDTPDIVLDHLMGDESAKSAAWSAARSAWSAWSAAESAWSTWSAAESAWSTWSAAESAWSTWSAADADFNSLVYECFQVQ